MEENEGWGKYRRKFKLIFQNIIKTCKYLESMGIVLSLKGHGHRVDAKQVKEIVPIPRNSQSINNWNKIKNKETITYKPLENNNAKLCNKKSKRRDLRRS